MFDTRPSQQQQQQQQQQQVIVKNPPVFARKSRAVADEKQAPGSDISCSKCKQTFSTRAAMRLHTCNSILDRHYLIDSSDRNRSPAPSAEAATIAPPPPDKSKAAAAPKPKAKSPDLLQNTMQAIELERMGDFKSSRKVQQVFNVIDSLFVETFKEDKDDGRADQGQVREVSIIAYLPQPESHQVVSQILDGMIDDITSRSTVNSSPKRKPSKRSSSEAFSRSGYVSKKRRMLARRRSAESLILAANEPRVIISEIVGDLVGDAVSKAEASLPTSPTTKKRTRPAKTGAEAFSRQSYSKKRR